jgi:hypothetical protein
MCRLDSSCKLESGSVPHCGAAFLAEPTSHWVHVTTCVVLPRYKTALAHAHRLERRKRPYERHDQEVHIQRCKFLV